MCGQSGRFAYQRFNCVLPLLKVGIASGGLYGKLHLGIRLCNEFMDTSMTNSPTHGYITQHIEWGRERTTVLELQTYVPSVNQQNKFLKQESNTRNSYLHSTRAITVIRYIIMLQITYTCNIYGKGQLE